MEVPMRESVGWEAGAVYRQRLPPDDTNRNADLPHSRMRYVMKKFIAAIALSTSVNAATVSPSSSEFGSNGY